MVSSPLVPEVRRFRRLYWRLQRCSSRRLRHRRFRNCLLALFQNFPIFGRRCGRYAMSVRFGSLSKLRGRLGGRRIEVYNVNITRQFIQTPGNQVADVAELADALDSKSSTRQSVWGRPPPSAPKGSVERCMIGTRNWPLWPLIRSQSLAANY